MEVIILRPVKEFLNELDGSLRMDLQRLFKLLGQYGHNLSMPFAKPIGRGLWELRYTGRPHIRVLYGYCEGIPILLLAFKKQRSSLRQHDIELALKRLGEYCA